LANGGKKKLELTDEQRVLVEENVKLVYFYAEKFVSSCPLDKDEIHAVMMYGLCKAAGTFKPDKSKFSTYATRCMRNELFMRLRQEKKWGRASYLNDIAMKADRMDDDDSASYEAFMYDKDDTPIEDQAVNTVTVERLKEWLLKQEKHMNDTTKKVVTLWVQNPGMTQADLAEQTNVSQAQVSRILKRMKDQIISTFFRGDDSWFTGNMSGESELSNEFMALSRNEEETLIPVRISIAREPDTVTTGFIQTELFAEDDLSVNPPKLVGLPKPTERIKRIKASQISLFDVLSDEQEGII
jgi:RNA polymerase sporulation-specific sigma factor